MQLPLSFSAVAVILGVIVGLLGFLPLFIASRRVTPASGEGSMVVGLASVMVSLISMFVFLLVFWAAFPDEILYFGISAISAFLAAIAVYAVVVLMWLSRSKTR